MLRNYLKIAWRNLKRRPGYTAMNVGGLAVGMATCLVIGIYLRHELSYDRFHENADRLYRVIRIDEGGGRARSSPGLARALETRFPALHHVTEVGNPQRKLVATDQNRFYVDNVIEADSQFFDVFSFSLVKGNPQTALTGPRKMVVTRSLARQLFGDKDPIGQTVTVENQTDYEVTGVVQDPPSTSHFQFDALLSLSSWSRKTRYQDEITWNRYSDFTYVRLRKNANPPALETRMQTLTQEGKPTYARGDSLALQPVTDIHLHSTNISGGIAPQGDPRYLYLFSVVGVLILLIACVNYMNLATARAGRRAREVGVRKVVGAGREQLARQFLGESVLTALIALPLAIGLAQGSLPLVNHLSGQELTFRYEGSLLAMLGGLMLVVGLASGSYPALVLSSFEPAQVLSGSRSGTGRRSGWLRRALVVFQFAASVALLIGTMVVWRQLDFIQHKRLGFDTGQIITFDADALGEQYEAFEQELINSTHVMAVTSGSPPGVGLKRRATPVTSPETGEKKWLYILLVGYDYFGMIGLNVKAGRTFSRARADSGNAYVLNTSAARLFDIEEDPIGQTISLNRNNQKTVIGVVEDFHNSSMRETIGPIAFELRPGKNWEVMVRLVAGRLEAGLNAVQQTWQQFQPNRPFNFSFLDDRIAAQYRAEKRLARVFTLFTGLAIFVACLGLFGLAAYAAERRTQEIGIRKTFGASTRNIVALLSTDFLKLVAVAFVFAAPVAYYAMHRWLQDFAYRIELSPWIFASAGVVALALALATVSYHALRAAWTNPADALRYE